MFTSKAAKALLLSILLATGPITAIGAAAPDPSVAARLGPVALAVIETYKRVTPFRVRARSVFGQTQSAAMVDGYYLTAPGAVRSDHSFIALLRRLLLDKRIYSAIQDRCIVDPGVVFRIAGAGASVDVVVCFKCDDLRLITRKSDGHVVSDFKTYFGVHRAEFLALALEAFPRDPTIRGLQDTPVSF